MQFEILKMTENEDGSANMEVEMDDETKSFLIQMGIIAVIKEAIATYPLPEEYDE